MPKKNILLIEDNPDHVLLTRKYLERTGQDYQLEATGDAQDALRKISENNYNLVLCDYYLTGLSAMDILKEMKKQGKDLPFVVITAAGNEKIAVELMKEGAYDYIQKDVSYEDILPAVVEQSIERFNVRKAREEAEQALQERENFLRSIFDGIQDGIIVLNRNFEIIRSNAQAEKIYHDQAPLVGKKCHEVVMGKDSPCIWCPSVKAFESGKTYREVIPHPTAQSPNEWFEISAFPLINNQGKIDGAIEHLKDVTDRKRAQEELEGAYSKLKETQQQLIQSSKMAAVGQLAAGISHELNQPLTGIKGFAQAILMDVDKRSHIRDDLNKIIEQADRMDRIIKNVRFFARKSDFKIEDVQINGPINDSLSLLEEQLRIHNIKLTKMLAKNLPKIKGDLNQLQQVCINLITNARDALDSVHDKADKELTIKTRVSANKSNIELIVKDNGSGIAKENLEQIFNPFFTTKSPEGGIGLGLAIIYRIIENHKGKIEVRSKVGKGTVFKVILPAGG